MKKKPNPRPTMHDRCAICGKSYACTHVVYYGNPNAALSQKYGMTMRLCEYCHKDSKEGIHNNKEFRDRVQKEYQQKFIETYPELNFKDIFGKNYL